MNGAFSGASDNAGASSYKANHSLNNCMLMIMQSGTEQRRRFNAKGRQIGPQFPRSVAFLPAVAPRANGCSRF
jgi:hypothetical protein